MEMKSLKETLPVGWAGGRFSVACFSFLAQNLQKDLVHHP
jgi:hypothetical protein